MTTDKSDWDEDWDERDLEDGEPLPEPPKPTASELIEADVARALRVLRSTISAAAANAHTAISRGLPDGVAFSSLYVRSNARTYCSAVTGDFVVVEGRKQRSLDLRCTESFASRFLGDCREVVSLERLGVSGDWILFSVQQVTRDFLDITFRELS